MIRTQRSQLDDRTHRRGVTRPGVVGPDLGFFLAVTFAVSWSAWGLAILTDRPATTPPTVVLFLLGGFGPAFGALATWARRRRRGQPPPDTARRVNGLRWLFPALLLGAGPVVVATLLTPAFGGPAWNPAPGGTAVRDLGGPVTFALLYLIAGPLSEEFGWRGTAHPRLRRVMGPYGVGLASGTVWVLWHLPLFLIPGSAQYAVGFVGFDFAFYVFSCYPQAVLLGHAYENWRGGVAGAVTVHFSYNVAATLLDADSVVALALLLAAQTIAAVGLTQWARHRGADGPARAATSGRRGPEIDK
ncbi:MAG TPA: CPBP family intramembrane glutamic endopeptidase [Catenuloplanes sp.]